MKYFKKQAPLIAAFISGFAVMSLEILGSRLVAPILGSSILVWTNLIGVILVALALGAWLGGVVSDRYPEEKIVAYMMFGAGIWSLIIVFVARYVLSWFPALPPGTAAPVISLILLAPPAFMLGAIPPALIRLSVKEITGSGHVAGMLSAIGSLGSLFGTYLTGYVLLPIFSISELTFGIAMILIVFSLLFFSGFFRKRLIISAAGFVFISVPVAFNSHDLVFPSAYNHVAVKNIVYRSQQVRALYINQGLHAAALPTSINKSVFEYNRGLESVDTLVTSPKRMLALGGGGLHLSREFLERHPESKVDVVEIDPAVIKAAKVAFGMNDDARLKIIIGDARTVINNLEPGYDLIIQDTFAGDLSVPWQLLTHEVFVKYKNLLAPNGIYAANIIMVTEPTGEAGKKFNRDFTATIRATFGWVIAVSMNNNHAKGQPCNVLIFAGNGQKPDQQVLAESVKKNSLQINADVLELLDNGRIWTDDYGPADYESIAMYREAY